MTQLDTTRRTVTVDEVATLLGISRASAYEGVRSGEIPSVRIGRRILVPRMGLERMLTEWATVQEVEGGESHE